VNFKAGNVPCSFILQDNGPWNNAGIQKFKKILQTAAGCEEKKESIPL